MERLIDSYGQGQGWIYQKRFDSRYRVLHDLALFAGPDPEGLKWETDDGYVPLSVDMMAKVVGYDRGTVSAAIADLEAMGALLVEKGGMEARKGYWLRDEEWEDQPAIIINERFRARKSADISLGKATRRNLTVADMKGG
jgi:hypothetical protein